MKIAVFLFEQGVNPKSPKVTQKSISIQQLKSEYHPDVLKKNHLSCFVDIEIEDNSIVRENKEIQTLSNTLSLTSSALEEIVTDQRPRLEYNVDFAFMLFKSISLYPSGEEHKIEYQVGLKIYDNVVLCVHYAQPTSLNVLQRYFERNGLGLIEGG